MRDHEVLSNTVRELERLHFGTQIGPKRAIRSSTSFLRQSRMGVRDTLCRTVWMQTFQESKGQYGWTESSTFLVLPKARFSTCSFRHAIGTGHVFCLLNISGPGSGPAVCFVKFLQNCKTSKMLCFKLILASVCSCVFNMPPLAQSSLLQLTHENKQRHFIETLAGNPVCMQTNKTGGNQVWTMKDD